MNRRSFWKNVGWAVLVLAILILLFPLSIGHGPIGSKGYQVMSFRQMEHIANALFAFATKNGGILPLRLSELVPKYLSDVGPLFFSSPYSQSWIPADAKSHPELIDVFSPYSYFKLPDGRIVVVERPGFWQDGKITYFIRGKDERPMGLGLFRHVTPEEFERRLKLNFPDLPLTGDYSILSDASIGSHHYVMVFSGRELEKIHTAFKASGKPPITAEAARAKAHAALEPPEPAGTWEVNEGALTSDGSTPHYRFECKYLKDGRKTGQSVNVMVLMDGTVLAPKLVK